MSKTWQKRETSGWNTASVLGYSVWATDGEIGDVADESTEVTGSHIVVDTGFWIFGKKRLIPAGAVSSVDHNKEAVYVQMTKDEIKDAPDLTEESLDDEARAAHEHYYAPWANLR